MSAWFATKERVGKKLLKECSRNFPTAVLIQRESPFIQNYAKLKTGGAIATTLIMLSMSFMKNWKNLTNYINRGKRGPQF
ncbi:hypothetical protein [Candidatus Electronema sp. JM]|uniref:hypothetical protein n=1 Tax=Candidatus Electronema sp. JM TaxID=3401571 RepID=UPI003AA7B9F8